MVSHRDGFAESLGFVVYTPRANWVDVPPVVLALGMHEGIAVHLRRRCEQEPCSFGLRDAQRVVCAERADLQRLNGKLEIVERGSRTREMQNPVEVTVEPDELRHVVLDECKFGLRREGGQVVT
jgi:hypothetical protein